MENFIETYRTKNKFDYSFTCPSSDYLNIMFNPILTYYNGIGIGDYVFNDEIIYKLPIQYRKYQKSSVIILAGGPTTNLVLNNLPTNDFIWSVNHFYLNPSLPKIDLAVLGKEPNKFDKNLIEYIEKNKTDIVFDEAKDDTHGEKYLNNLFPDSVSWYNTRYQSKLGIGCRMIIYAIMVGVKNIYFAGIDGYTIDGKNNHSFQKDKSLPKWGLDNVEIYNLMDKQYKEFWSYVMHLKTIYPFSIKNLGEEFQELNQLSKFTKKQ